MIIGVRLMSAGAAVWLGLCAVGAGVLWSHARGEGVLGEPSPSWPLASVRPPDPADPTLVLFAHPRCPCTSAGLSAVERLMARFPGGFGVVVVFFEPEEAEAGWRGTRLWRRAASLPGAVAVPDPGGRMAARAGAMTSGVAGLYGADGRLLFWGGLTPGRGHEGDSAGTDALAGALRGGTDGPRVAPVYGCPILGSCDGSGPEDQR